MSFMLILMRNNKQNGRRIRVNSIKKDFKLDKSIWNGISLPPMYTRPKFQFPNISDVIHW